jgi:DNA polymerase-1
VPRDPRHRTDRPRARRRPTLHLIDASPYVFRAWFSIPSSVRAPDGASVHALHGFAAFLLRYLSEERPTHLALAFDRSLDTSFRHELYPDYKASREEAPDELSAQFELCEELARLLGLAVVAHERYEADDLIATLAARHARSTARRVVVTSDKDLAQLVDARTTLYDFARGQRLGPREVRARFGVAPRQMADLLGLAGDAVDDIPGVRGVGAVTAAALLARFGDLEGVYRDLARVAALDLRGAAGLAARLEAGRASAFLSRELATLARDAPVRGGLDDLALDEVDRDGLERFCERVGFGRLRERLLARR